MSRKNNPDDFISLKYVLNSIPRKYERNSVDGSLINFDGENIYGAILGFNYEKIMLGYNLDFTITRTEYRGESHD